MGSATCPECPTKDWRGKSYWLNPRESGPEVIAKIVLFLAITSEPQMLESQLRTLKMRIFALFFLKKQTRNCALDLGPGGRRSEPKISKPTPL